jgi:hypothetical protein
VDSNIRFRVCDHFLILGLAGIRRSHCDVIGFYPQILQALLNIDAHGAATPPKPYNKCGPEAAVVYLHTQPERIVDQIYFSYELFGSHS